MTYKIVRFSFDGSKRTMFRGLSLADAQAHCDDPQNQFEHMHHAGGKRTKAMIARHNRNPWFHGFTEE